MNLRHLWRVFVRVIVSLFCAGISYSVWLATFLLTAHLDSRIAAIIRWLLAPVMTAMGFAMGVMVSERLTGASRVRFWRIFVWPLIGCALGAVAVYWFGPMLIVFGMFVIGASSVVLREIILIVKQDGD